MALPVQLRDVQRAAKRIGGAHLRTPLVPLNAAGGRIWLKAECLQEIGAFKIRGALNAMRGLSRSQLDAGVVAYSSGNHGRAVSRAAQMLGATAVVVMADDSVQVKIDATRALGAEVVLVPATERTQTAVELARARGSTLIPPFDDPDVIAGQGTIGLEILQSFDADSVFVPVGGGGLISGIAVAVKGLRPEVKVIGVEPALAGDLAESFSANRLISWSPALTARTIADGVRSPCVGDIPWAIIRELVDDVVTVSETGIIEAMQQIAFGARLLAEPSGAVALAGFNAVRGEYASRRPVAVVSGGNVAPEHFLALMAQGRSAP